MTVSKSFSAVGVSDVLAVQVGQTLSYAVSGTFSGSVLLEKQERGRGDWKPVLAAITAAASGQVLAEEAGKDYARYRWRCTARVSGTIVTSLADITTEVGAVIKALDGSVVLQATEDGPIVPPGKVLGSSGLTITGATQTASFPALNITQTNSATSGTLVHASLAPTFSSSSTSTMVGVGFRVAPTINYSNGTPGAGSYEALKIAVTETALPTGQSYLARMSAGAAGTTDKWSVTNSGAVTQAAGLTISSGAIRFANSTGDIGLVGTSIQVVAAGGFSWSTNSTWNSTGDVFLRRDAAGTLALRNSTNAQTFNIYNTYTDASNYARLSFAAAASGPYVITPQAAGTGTLRGLQIGATGTSLGFFGATPVAQPTTAVTAAAFVANTSGIVDDSATFGGYTLGQVVAALKSIGALA